MDPLKDYLRKYKEANKLQNIKADELPTTGLKSMDSPVMNAMTVASSSTSNHNHTYQQLPQPGIRVDPTQYGNHSGHHLVSEGQLGTIGAEGSHPNNTPLPTTLQTMPMFIDTLTNQYYINGGDILLCSGIAASYTLPLQSKDRMGPRPFCLSPSAPRQTSAAKRHLQPLAMNVAR